MDSGILQFLVRVACGSYIQQFRILCTYTASAISTRTLTLLSASLQYVGLLVVLVQIMVTFSKL